MRTAAAPFLATTTVRGVKASPGFTWAVPWCADNALRASAIACRRVAGGGSVVKSSSPNAEWPAFAAGRGVAGRSGDAPAAGAASSAAATASVAVADTVAKRGLDMGGGFLSPGERRPRWRAGGRDRGRRPSWGSAVRRSPGGLPPAPVGTLAGEIPVERAPRRRSGHRTGPGARSGPPAGSGGGPSFLVAAE